MRQFINIITEGLGFSGGAFIKHMFDNKKSVHLKQTSPGKISIKVISVDNHEVSISTTLKSFRGDNIPDSGVNFGTSGVILRYINGVGVSDVEMKTLGNITVYMEDGKTLECAVIDYESKKNETDTSIDWQGNEQPKPVAKNYNQVHASGSVELFQHTSNPKKFAVRYGLQLKKDLDYAQSAKEFGECVMHELTSEGKLK